MMKVLFHTLCLVLLLAGCATTKYVPVESFRTDSVYVTKETHDTLRTFDSIYVENKGDTVRIERWRTMYKSLTKVDTVMVLEQDTIRVPYEVVKEVRKGIGIKDFVFIVCIVLIVLLIFSFRLGF